MSLPVASLIWWQDSLWLSVQTALLAWSLIGWGTLAYRAAGGKLSPPGKGAAPNLFEFGVVGVGAVFVLGGGLSFVTVFSPVLGTGVLLTGLLGYGYLVWSRRAKLSDLCLHWGLTGLLAAFFAFGAGFTGIHYDTGLYHLQQILWYQAEPVPFGLANLMANYGYFSSWFLITSLFSVNSILPDLLFLVNAALSVVAGGALLQLAVERTRTGRLGFCPLLGLISVLLMFFAGRPIFFSWMGASPSTDLPAAWLAIYVLVRFAVLIEDKADLRSLTPECGWGLFAVFAGSAAAVSVKLSQFPVALMVVAGAVWLLWRSDWTRWRPLLAPAAGAAAIAVLWVSHGLITSGCVAFPSGASCIGWLPWTVDADYLDHFARFFKAWSRAPGLGMSEETEGLRWLPHWMELMYPNRPFLPRLATISAGLIVAALALRIVFRKRVAGKAAGLPWVLAAVLAEIVVVAIGAPDPRYCLGAIIAVPAALVAWLAMRPVASPSRASRVLVAVALLATAGFGWRELRHRLPEFSANANCCEWRRLPQVETKLVTSTASSEVFKPVRGDQCWTVPGPCTPYPNERLRETRDLGHRAFIWVAPPRVPAPGETAPP